MFVSFEVIEKNLAYTSVIGKRALGYEEIEDREEEVKKEEIRKLREEMKILKSFYSEPQTQQAGGQRKERMRGYLRGSNKLWQVVKVAITIPILGKFLVRDLSPLKPVMVEGEWNRVVS